MWTAAFERYVEPARDRAQIWRLILGVVLGIVIMFLTGIVLGILIIGLLDDSDSQRVMATLTAATTPATMLMMLATFTGMALAPMAAVRLLHRRSVGSLFGPRAVVVRDFLRAGVTVLGVYAVLIALWFTAFDAVPNIAFSDWIVFLPLAVIGVLIQTGSEELVFRAYLVQQLAARFRSPLVWFIVPAIAFGALHYSPGTAGANAILLVLATGLFGLVATDITRRTGSIGAAWGMHFVNNLFAILFLATDGHLTGLSLFVTPYGAGDTILPMLLLGDAATLLVTWYILIRILPR
ncbi:MAG: CPBP family intramembrane metalloprotease [Paracoccaceae bacterium]|nr:CPBP family intramembrane metalloprotease [Paracoccaceae bacterium]